MANGMSRVEARQHFDDKTRLRLLENDIDAMQSELKAAVEGMRAASNRLVWSVVALLGTVVAGLVAVILSVPR